MKPFYPDARMTVRAARIGKSWALSWMDLSVVSLSVTSLKLKKQIRALPPGYSSEDT
jgi:hypothetical protein